MAELEVVVVGGGPAGLLTALEARALGLAVAVLDGRRPPIDKACGEGLMPDGLARLRALGVELPALRELRLFHGIRYVDGALEVEGRFPAGVAGAGIRRTTLHAALVARAEAVGVDLRWGVKVQGLVDGGVLTGEGRVVARWVVGADGLLSDCRRWAGLETSASSVRRFGVRRHFALAPWTDCVEVHWGPGAEAYVTPVADDEVGVAILWRERKAGFDTLLELFPALAARLQGAAPASKDRGAGPLEQRVATVARGRLALVGDAAGYLDAITGEGLSLASHQAQALAQAIAAGDLGRYRRRHAAIGRLPNFLTRLTLFLEDHPRLRRRVLRAFAADPRLFEQFLAVHVRAAPGRTLLDPRLLWRLL